MHYINMNIGQKLALPSPITSIDVTTTSTNTPITPGIITINSTNTGNIAQNGQHLIDTNATYRCDNLFTTPESFVYIITHPTQCGPIKSSIVINKDTTYTIDFTPDPQHTASILFRVYLHQQQWKIHAQGQGYNDGIASLTQAYQLTSSNIPAPKSAHIQEAPKSISLKKGTPISLEKPTRGFPDIHISLSWSQRRSGIFSRPTPIDLDLGAFVETQDGKKYVIQALGNKFGNYDRAPYVRLPADHRDGGQSEFLNVNGTQWPNIRRIQVYAYIYEGVKTWADIDGIVRIQIQHQPEMIIELNEPHQRLSTCAIAEIKNNYGNLTVTKQETYHTSQSTMDQRLRGWNFSWSPGRK